MNQDETIEIGENRADGHGLQSAESVDDFIRTLEAIEKDLHISPELEIEVSESEFDDSNLPEFIIEDLTVAEKSIEVKRLVSPDVQFQLKTEIAELEKSITRFKDERAELVERSRRQMADFENFRSRIERERQDTFSSQLLNLAGQMLPVLDNLERALEHASAIDPEIKNDIAPFLDGIVLVNQQIIDVLAGMGVQPISAVGEEFDPHFHEAVVIETCGKLPPNTISEEMLRGYRMGDRVIRHSMVKVVKPEKVPEVNGLAFLGDDPDLEIGESEFEADLPGTLEFDQEKED